MSSTNKTTHYDLSQYVGTDKPTYLSDYNSDMAKIDAALYQANTNASSAEANASTALTQAGQALEKANTNEGDITNLENVTNLLNTNVATLNTFMNTVENTNMNTITLNPTPYDNQFFNITASNLKMNTYTLENLKLTSIYGSVSCHSLKNLTSRSNLQVNLGEQIKTLLPNRLFTNAAILSIGNNNTVMVAYIETQTSSVNYAIMLPLQTTINIPTDTDFTFFVQICILG